MPALSEAPAHRLHDFSHAQISLGSIFLKGTGALLANNNTACFYPSRFTKKCAATMSNALFMAMLIKTTAANLYGSSPMLRHRLSRMTELRR